MPPTTMLTLDPAARVTVRFVQERLIGHWRAVGITSETCSGFTSNLG
jgi:hypothetical protein